MTSATKPAIAARHLTKVYRLYERPQQRILDLLGIGRRGSYTEHFALEDVSITVARGERLGVIGRNGAGKSTLLKLVSGVIPPTSGSIEVNGNARALLEIGTGFPPEFTGRDNAKAYFAQLGISGRRASELLDEVVDFAELEEYIDQPLKTYSTGMKLRLMFATSTVTAPDILVLDEVLGVGDAYFTRKSFDRINELSAREGATLLLVSHDIYTSARVCDRMVWLEKGRVVFDGDPKDAVKAYEDSIRQQEEARLRSKSALALQRDQDRPRHKPRALHVELSSADGGPLPGPVWLRSVRLLSQSKEIARLPVVDGVTTSTLDDHPAGNLADGGPASSALDLEGTCWGDVGTWLEAPARPMRDYGSPFHRAGGTMLVPSAALDDLRHLTLAIELGADTAAGLVVSCRVDQHLVAQQLLQVGNRGWEHVELPLGQGLTTQGALSGHPGTASVFGTGRIRIAGPRLTNASGQETFDFWHGEPFTFSFDYEVRDPELNENCDIAVSLQRSGVDTSCRVFTRSLRFDYNSAPQGTVSMTLDHLMLGTGPYSVSLQVAREGYYDRYRESDPFYTVNPDVHVAVRQLIDFNVHAKRVLAQATAWVAEGHWALSSQPTQAPTTTRPDVA